MGRPLRDNTRFLIAGILVLLGALAALLALANRSTGLAPDFLTEFVLYALSATNLTFLVGLVFVLARNIIKMMVERRKGLPFSKFRAKLVGLLIGMTLLPALLVLIVGGELIRNSVGRWFNAPMDEVLSSANAIAGDYYQERQRLVAVQAARMARSLGGGALSVADVHVVADPDVRSGRVTLVEVYRAERNGAVAFVTAASAPAMPQGYSRQTADRLAARVASAGRDALSLDPMPGGAQLVRSAVPIRGTPSGPVTGVVIASEYLTGEFATRARRLTDAYEGYQQLRVLQQPLTGVYLSFFLMLTLMILVGSTWMGLYMAKRITRPVQMLAVAAKEIGAGHLEHRIVPETVDEFGSLIEAFNSMASDLATSRRRLEQSALELERKHHEVEGRRQYVETILDRVATGVIAIDAAGKLRTVNSAALRLLGIEVDVIGLPADTVFGEADLKPLGTLIDVTVARSDEPRPQDVKITRLGRELHLAVMVTPLRRDDGGTQGLVIVIDDVTPLVRAQKVAAWREVARRLAHEIKNPLTPIQLSAERLRRHFATAPQAARDLVDECTNTIVGEVQSLKELVDEFSQFARMPAPRAVATDLHALLGDVLILYSGLFADVVLKPCFAADLPAVSVDPEQIRRVMINLIDNAIEAMDQRGTIEIATAHDPANNLVRIVVGDDGPGIPAVERDKLFLPYYSTKRRGSGLGLAIVRRIVAEHGGSIDVADNTPHGTRFIIELPIGS